jgi:DNA invertase Pin-like site-specific DNA recombinase
MGDSTMAKPSKVGASHLKRDAFLYVRQSTLQQVVKNTESTQRQYALRQRAVALGWPMERVRVIDCDLGQSGASANDRAGFQQLVSEVGLGHAGVVLGLEVSRLARNSTDWHRLLELCALADTLILDEDGLYDCNDFNDRLLLGLKGTMSEAELHFLRARMRGGILSKAKRGELKVPIPIGFVYDEQMRVQLDPDAQIRGAIELLFATFRRTGSALATVKYFQKNTLRFPRRLRKGVRMGEVIWGTLHHARVLQILHNPRYAGAFFFGRTRTVMTPQGKTQQGPNRDRDSWVSLIQNAHAGYITWEEFEDNQKRLLESANGHGVDRRKSPPGEGSALLQGMGVCGVCGRRMTVRYHQWHGHPSPVYVCQRDLIDLGGQICQSIPGRTIDAAITQVLFETMTPINVELALAVQQEIAARQDEVVRIRSQAVERAQFEAELARQRYLRVDPNNRLVASALEADWNEAMSRLQHAQDDLEQQRKQDALQVNDAIRERIMALVTDFPRVWSDPHTTDRDRKRMVRLLIQDVTLTKTAERILVQVRFCGGRTQTLTLPTLKPSWQAWATRPDLLTEIDGLLNEHTDRQVADILNARGERSGTGRPFSAAIVKRLRRNHHFADLATRLRQRGWLSASDMAGRLNIARRTVIAWGHAGLINCRPATDKGDRLYEWPQDGIVPCKHQGKKLRDRRRFEKFAPQLTQEVQHEA